MAIPVASNLKLTPDEQRYFYQLFQVADTDRLGVVTGEVAVKFFEKTKLLPPTLGEVRGRSQRPSHQSLTSVLSTDLANCGHGE